MSDEIEVGQNYHGTVVRLMDFGAFVNIMPGKDGLVHISQIERYALISNERVKQVSDVLKEGDKIVVKVLELDKQGRIRLSMKSVKKSEPIADRLDDNNAHNKLSEIYETQCCAKFEDVLEGIEQKRKLIQKQYDNSITQLKATTQDINNRVIAHMTNIGNLGSAGSVSTTESFSDLRSSQHIPLAVRQGKEFQNKIDKLKKLEIGVALPITGVVFVALWIVLGLVNWDSDQGFIWALLIVGGYWGIRAARLVFYTRKVASSQQSINQEGMSIIGKSNYLAEQEKQRLEDKRQDEINELEREIQIHLPALTNEVSDTLASLQTKINELPLEAIPLDHKRWADWCPPEEIKDSLRLGSWRTRNLQSQTQSVVGNIHPPHLFLTKSRQGLLIERSVKNRNAIAADLALKWLTTCPPGKCRLLICDPSDAGDHVSNLFKLIDFDDRLINGKVWTNTNQITEKIEELSNHVEIVIQQYLRNDFKTLADYHDHIGEIAVPINVVVLFGFPKGIRDDTLDNLVTIAKNGLRCGVHLVVVEGDEENPNRLEGIDLFTRVLTSYKQITSPRKYMEFVRDNPISADRSDQIVTSIGQTAREGSNLTVDWESAMALFERNVIEDPNKFSTVAIGDDSQLVGQSAEAAIPLWTGNSASGLQAPIGRASATRSQAFAVGPVVREKSAHTMLVGRTGTGKSSMLHSLILSLSHLYSPDEIELYLLDFKGGVEFKDYAKYSFPHAKVVAIQSDRELGLTVLATLNKELEKRSDVFRDAGVQDLEGYRNQTNLPLPRILAIIDEFQVIFSGTDKVASESDELLENLVRQGRSFGIHIFLASQSMDISSNFSRDKIYDQMANRIALAVGDNDVSRVFGDDNLAAKDLSAPGEAIYNHKGGEVSGNSKFQGALVTDVQKEICLKQIRARYDSQYDPSYKPFIFEGSVEANYDDFSASFVEEVKSMSSRSSSVRLLLGAPVSIRDPIQVALQRDLGNNLISIGTDKRVNECLVTSIVRSNIILNAEREDKSVDIVLFNGVAGDEEGDKLEQLCDDIADKGLNINLKQISTRPKDVEGEIKRLIEEVEQRTESQTSNLTSIVVLVNRLQGIKMFRVSEDDIFGVGIDDSDEDEVNIQESIKNILIDGPAVGVHFCVVADSTRAFKNSCFGQRGRDFSYKMIHSLNPDDANDVLGGQRVSIVDRNRVYLYDYDSDELTKFKPLH